MRDVLGIFQVFVAEGRYPTARALVKALEDAGLDPEVLADEDEDAEDVADVTTALRRAIWRFAWSTLLTVPVLALSWSPKLDAKFVARTGASFGLTTINLVALARPIFVSAFRAVFIGHELDADVLITLSSLSAYLYCVVSYAYNVSVGSIRLETYFETPSLLITLILLGRTVAVFTRSRAALRFAALASSKTETAHAKLYDPRTGTSASIHPALLDPGDHVVIPPGALIVSDGVVILGIADVDESLVTGESLAITKSPGATVIAGTRIVGPAALHVRLTHAVHENRLADIRRIVAEARSSRAPVQDVADALASYIVPLVLVVAVATILIWTIVAALHMHMSGGAAFASALSYAVAVLAISCPCALALCVPLVVIVSGDVAARRGLLIKSSAALQKARRVSHVIFDKTGTLTTGRMRVTQEYVSPSPGAHCPAQLVAALVEGDMHPVSKAVRAYMEAKGQPQVPCTLAERETHPGLGVSARLSGETLRGGSPVWCQQTSHQVVEDMVCAGKSVFCVTIGSVLLAVYALEDDLRPESKAVVAALRTRGIRVSILSGDNQAATMAVGALLGLEPHNVRGGCMPDDKRDAVRIAAWKDVCAQEKKHIPDSAKKASANATSSESIVMFVGDGSNDAGALSQAGVGIALSSGTSLAGSSAEIIILNGSLSTILTMIDMSSQVWRRILLSFSWAACYNFFGVLLASVSLHLDGVI